MSDDFDVSSIIDSISRGSFCVTDCKYACNSLCVLFITGKPDLFVRCDQATAILRNTIPNTSDCGS